jgi:hypothetical protein
VKHPSSLSSHEGEDKAVEREFGMDGGAGVFIYITGRDGRGGNAYIAIGSENFPLFSLKRFVKIA